MTALRTCLFGIILALTLPGCAATGQLDPQDAGDSITINRKIMCSTVDGQATTYWWHGKAYSRRMGERDKHLFNVEGMNIRACSAITDDKRGKGYKLVSREILLYKDPKTDEVLSTWTNPWTNEEVTVMHVANDPVNFSSYEIDRSGDPAAWSGELMGNRWWWTNTVPLFYPNTLASEYQKEIGGTYHATEMFNFFGDTASLLDPNATTAVVQVGWSRMSDWLPWMMMQGREGTIYMHTAGRKLERFEDLSDTMKREIRAHYPEYDSPPPLDDARRNETSWSYYKKIRNGERKLPERQ